MSLYSLQFDIVAARAAPHRSGCPGTESRRKPLELIKRRHGFMRDLAIPQAVPAELFVSPFLGKQGRGVNPLASGDSGAAESVIRDDFIECHFRFSRSPEHDARKSGRCRPQMPK